MTRRTARGFDGVLVVAFGGPQGPADIRPFLERVLRGRRVTPERIEDVARHYEIFDGVSPITRLTELQARGLEARLAAAGNPLPVYVGMRNWHPLLADTLRDMHRAGVRQAVGFIAAAHHSYSSCQQYRENVADARRELLAGIAASPEEPTLHALLAEIYDRTGLRNVASQEAQEAERLSKGP